MTTAEFAGGVPRPDARLVPLQRIKHQGALEMHRDPLRIGAIAEDYRPRFAAAFGVERHTEDPLQRALAELHTVSALRHTILRMFGYRSIPHYYKDITQALDDADAGRNARPDSWFPVAEYLGRSEQLYDYLIKSPPAAGIIAARDATFNSFSELEQEAVAETFKALSLEQKEATGAILDIDYPGWRELDAETLENPHRTDLPPDEIRLLSRLQVDEDIKVIGLNAAISAEIGTLATLSELHTALAATGCPENERWEVSYANLRKLGIFAQISSRVSGRILGEIVEPDHPSMFDVKQRDNDTWEVNFSEATDNFRYLKKVYERFDVADCQGATEIYPLDLPAQQTMQHVQQRINGRVGNNPMDIQFDSTTSAAEMGTLLVTAHAQRDGINIIRR